MSFMDYSAVVLCFCLGRRSHVSTVLRCCGDHILRAH